MLPDDASGNEMKDSAAALSGLASAVNAGNQLSEQMIQPTQ
jgi:hypothetical protein